MHEKIITGIVERKLIPMKMDGFGLGQRQMKMVSITTIGVMAIGFGVSCLPPLPFLSCVKVEMAA